MQFEGGVNGLGDAALNACPSRHSLLTGGLIFHSQISAGYDSRHLICMFDRQQTAPCMSKQVVMRDSFYTILSPLCVTFDPPACLFFFFFPPPSETKQNKTCSSPRWNKYDTKLMDFLSTSSSSSSPSPPTPHLLKGALHPDFRLNCYKTLPEEPHKI